MTWYRVIDTSDLDELAAMQPGWQLRYDQLSAGPFRARMRMLQLPGLRITEEWTSRAVHQRGCFASEDVGLALGTRHAQGAYFHGQPIDADTVMIGRGDAIDIVTPDDNVLIGMVVDQALLSEVWMALFHKPWSTWLDCKLAVRARPGMADSVRSLQLRLLDSAHTSPAQLHDPQGALRMRDAILYEWIEALPERVDTSALPAAHSRRALVDRACAWALQRADDPPSLLEVCREVGTSPRKLEACFREVLGASPSRYLKTMRLNAVRRELKGASQQRPLRIHDIAARWGFWHMGSFSADYKRQFGELPSATASRGASAQANASPG